jgi:hypothetical protein
MEQHGEWMRAHGFGGNRCWEADVLRAAAI